MGSTGEHDRKSCHFRSISPTAAAAAAKKQVFTPISEEKKVVTTKCYHLFCNPGVHRIIERRHRKGPACSASFWQNDVKPIYI